MQQHLDAEIEIKSTISGRLFDPGSGVHTIRMKHFGDKSHCWRFIWIFLCEFNGKFEGS